MKLFLRSVRGGVGNLVPTSCGFLALLGRLLDSLRVSAGNLSSPGIVECVTNDVDGGQPSAERIGRFSKRHRQCVNRPCDRLGITGFTQTWLPEDGGSRER
jgi:hypothetical protein